MGFFVGSGNAQSSVALCTSYVPGYNKYYTSLRFQDARREVVFEIKQMVVEVSTMPPKYLPL